MGLKPFEFWELTFAELAKMIEGYTRRKQDDMNMLIYHAWHVAAFDRQKKLPSLKGLLKNNRPKRKQTEAEMLAVVKALNAAFGGEYKEI